MDRLPNVAGRDGAAAPGTVKTIRSALVLAAGALALTGCASGPSYAVLDRAAGDEDALPSELPASATEGADAETARFAGEHEDVALWLLRSEEPGGICLLAFRDPADWRKGCAGADLTVDGTLGAFTVVRDGGTPPAGATQVSENVYALS
ncbi:hypothetical protein [Agrococcus carbonis]|uniref:Uncharacterized protein n=1 Tax=Agrococcus carbonis TaxID=684552 RepID=A0A1H1MPF3_9MICO|nr:hypothetical protein [Agrococcus carbonis]SDR88723.1 hypothetical protein SAMN04489719_1048 [Agrococcus carbonis]